jgi:hypothetical protein
LTDLPVHQATRMKLIVNMIAANASRLKGASRVKRAPSLVEVQQTFSADFLNRTGGSKSVHRGGDAIGSLWQQGQGRRLIRV